MTIKALFPTVRPTLNLDFAKTKALDPRITFTRASTGAYVGADGLIKTAAVNEARFDHNPTTGESLGFLVEEARTNVRLYSNDLADTTAWDARMTKVPNSIISPDGTLNGWKVSDNSTGTNRYIGHAETGGTGTVFSMYVKRDPVSTTGTVYIAQSSITVTPILGTFNLDAGTATASNGATVFMHSAGNGWYRIGTYLAAGQRGVLGLSIITGDPSRSVYVYGGQLEAGSFPTSYIPTVASTVTRAADVASMTGTNFSSWYNQSEGTLFANARSSGSSNSNFLAALNLTSAAGTVFADILEQSTTVRLSVYNSSIIYSVTPGTSGALAGSTRKAAIALKASNYGAALNGTASTSGTNATAPPVFDRLLIMNFPGFGTANGTIARLAYYPVRLPDAQLQALTAT